MPINVSVVYSPAASQLEEVTLTLAPGATVEHALERSGLGEVFPEIVIAPLTLGVWGREVSPGHVLQDHDRVEIYRPLKVDPKVARRTRFQQQGSRSAGLFARKRAGAKAGY